MDNENGFYPIFETDEYGFNNGKNLYLKDQVDVLITGDSFAEGTAVNQSETVQSKLNDLGFKTISLGKVSNGPLIQLATLKEYATVLKPKTVFWFYFRNDLSDLENAILSAAFSQNKEFVSDILNFDDQISFIIYVDNIYPSV